MSLGAAQKFSAAIAKFLQKVNFFAKTCFLLWSTFLGCQRTLAFSGKSFANEKSCHGFATTVGILDSPVGNMAGKNMGLKLRIAIIFWVDTVNEESGRRIHSTWCINSTCLNFAKHWITDFSIFLFIHYSSGRQHIFSTHVTDSWLELEQPEELIEKIFVEAYVGTAMMLINLRPKLYFGERPLVNHVWMGSYRINAST